DAVGRTAVDVGGKEGSIRSDDGVAVDVVVSRRAVGADHAHRVNDRLPRLDVEDAVVVGVKILAVAAVEVEDEEVGDIVAVLEVERGQQVRAAEGDGLLGEDKESVTGDRVTREVDHRLDDTAAAGAVTEDDVGHAVQARTGRADDLGELVEVGAGLVDADLA